MELLFDSRGNLSDFTGTVHFVQWKPEIHPEPLIRPDTPADAGGVSAYGTVLKEGGRFRYWYQAVPGDWDFREDVSTVACAESDDGFHWRKPALSPTGAPSHLCNLGLHSPSVFIDPAAPPERRYRATGCAKPGAGSCGRRYGYYTASSADGVHWEIDSGEPCWEGGDVITGIYHPGRAEGIVALKEERWGGRIRRRCIRTAAYRDGCFTGSVYALCPDEYDDVAALQRGYASGDYYGMAMLPAGRGTAGFLWNFRHDLPYSPGGAGMYGNSDITLVFQEEAGDRWLHAPGRPVFIGHRDLPWTSHGWIHSASQPVEVGDEHWLYFSGTNFSHGFSRENGQLSPRRIEWVRRHGSSGITLARWPKFRLFGFEAPAEASFRIRLDGFHRDAELHLNFTTRPGGCIRVSVEGGHSLETCLPMEGDAVDAPVRWQGGTRIPAVPGGRRSVTLVLESAAVYAYRVVPL